MNGLTRQPGNPVLVNIGIHCDTWRLPYNEILSDLSLMKISKYDTWKLAVREVCETDFFLFCLMILNLPVNDPFLLARCYEIQDHEDEDGLYLWARDHWKSTLITYARTLWRFCRIYGNRVALFSNSTKLATPRFKQMKNVMETNALLHELWPEVFWKNPEKESPTWSIDDGLFLKGNDMPWPSLGRFGLIDSMPTGGHYNEKIIDDLVDLKNIGTSFMMEKVKEAYGMADNLGSGENTIETVIGTRYKFGDLYEHIMGLGQHRISIIPGEVNESGNALFGGIPVYHSKEALDNKKIKQRHTYHAQILQQPLQQGSAAFKTDDLRFYDKEPDFGKYYIVADPATDPELSTNPGRLDSTVMWLVKACAGRRIYIIDMIRDKIGNKKKWSQLKDWHARYDIMDTGYEEFATQKDREYFKEKMEEERFYFKITPLKHNRGSKPERIGILADYFSEGKIYLPRNLMRLTRDRGVVDLISEFINDEYMKYPMTEHDDMLDALAKVSEMDIIYPEGDIEKEEQKIYNKPSPLDDDFRSVECHWGDL